MIGAQIKALRQRHGLSARGLAEVLNLQSADGRYIRFLESGERHASGPIIRLLEMLDRGELPARYLPAKSGKR